MFDLRLRAGAVEHHVVFELLEVEAAHCKRAVEREVLGDGGHVAELRGALDAEHFDAEALDLHVADAGDRGSAVREVEATVFFLVSRKIVDVSGPETPSSPDLARMMFCFSARSARFWRMPTAPFLPLSSSTSASTRPCVSFVPATVSSDER